MVTDDPDLERAAQGMIDENGVILYHNNIAPTENGFWVEAKDLREGDVFLGANGELSTVVSIERVEFPDGIAVYNLTVDGNHNYFVIAACDEYGQTSVLVHNAGYGDPMGSWNVHEPHTWVRTAFDDTRALFDHYVAAAKCTAELSSEGPYDPRDAAKLREAYARVVAAMLASGINENLIRNHLANNPDIRALFYANASTVNDLMRQGNRIYNGLKMQHYNPEVNNFRAIAIGTLFDGVQHRQQSQIMQERIGRLMQDFNRPLPMLRGGIR